MLQRPQAGEHHGHRGATQTHRPRRGVTGQLLRVSLRHTGLSGTRDRPLRTDRRDRYLHRRQDTGGTHARSAHPQRSIRRRSAGRRSRAGPLRLVRSVAAPCYRSRPPPTLRQHRGDVRSAARRSPRSGCHRHRRCAARSVHGFHPNPVNLRRRTARRPYRRLPRRSGAYRETHRTGDRHRPAGSAGRSLRRRGNGAVGHGAVPTGADLGLAAGGPARQPGLRWCRSV